MRSRAVIIAEMCERVSFDSSINKSMTDDRYADVKSLSLYYKSDTKAAEACYCNIF